MADVETPRPAAFATRMALAGRGEAAAGTTGRRLVNPPLHRGSTVVYPTIADRHAAGRERMQQALVYGTHGNPTHFALEDVVAEIEGGTRCQLVSSGLAAVTTPLLAYLAAGDHILVPDSVYGPTRAFCEGMLRRLGIQTTYYDPCATAEALRAQWRPQTRLLYLESPGSHTFEVQDVRALAAVAHAQGGRVLLDNTWGVHFFQPFEHGVDVSIQVLTKYVGGHSDLLLGAVVTNATADWERVRAAALELGQLASPDDCWLALRGARTLAVRLARQMESGLVVARWLAERPEIARVLHPALPSCPGHAFWKRDFSGASSLFGVVFDTRFGAEAVAAMTESLRLFGIGASWGGYDSLALPSHGIVRTAGTGGFGGEAMRLHVGLEDPVDLIEDLAHGLEVLAAHPAPISDPGQ